MNHMRPISAPRPKAAALVGGGGGTAKIDLVLSIKAAWVDYQFAKNSNVISGA
jgi:hypothetical protein